MKKFIKNNLLWLIMIPVGVIVDQISKIIVLKNLTSTITIIKNLFYFRLTYNTGAAWSILSDKTWVLAIISIIACAGIAFYYFKGKYTSKWVKVALVMLFTGAFGNMIDRIFRGVVIDFIDFNFFILFNSTFPIFNIADMFVTVGAIVLIVGIIFFEKDSK